MREHQKRKPCICFVTKNEPKANANQYKIMKDKWRIKIEGLATY